MKLLTARLTKETPRIGATRDKGPDDIKMVAKFFTPWSGWTWYMAEYDPSTTRAWGYVVGHERELGYFMLSELESISGPGGLKIERDRHFKPKSLREVMDVRF